MSSRHTRTMAARREPDDGRARQRSRAVIRRTGRRPGTTLMEGYGMSQTSQRPDAVLRSTAETVIWGWIAADRAPVLTVKSGDVVRVDTVTHQGVSREDPVTYFGRAGI